MEEVQRELMRRANIILERIDGIAVSGTKEDAVKLQANQVLLNKILPDKQHLDISISEPPLERIARILAGKEPTSVS
jgi:sugar (pentulose or hexulose) kinase